MRSLLMLAYKTSPERYPDRQRSIEETPHHDMTWHDYFPEELAHFDHFYSQQPQLWNRNRGAQGEVAGHLGMSSQHQVARIR